MKILCNYFLLFVLSCLFNAAIAQEKLSTLITNPAYLQAEPANVKSAKKVLELPFVDDFSSGNVYPNEELWEDRHAYINQTMSVNPPTIGVATLDGLNDEGQPWDPSSINNDGASEPCDTLTSMPINLEGKNPESLYLSFYYQPEGLTGKPEPGDSLILEFKSITGKWEAIWKMRGKESHDFKAKMINVGEEYLYNNFQFRFRNLATPTGYNDFWHIDYVKLDDGRNIDLDLRKIEIDTVIDWRSRDTIIDIDTIYTSIFTRDLAIAGVPTSIFNNYSVTTLGQFFRYQDTVLNDDHSFTINNLDRDVFPCDYSYEINLLNTNDSLFGLGPFQISPTILKSESRSIEIETKTFTNIEDSVVYINDLSPDTLQLEMKYYISPDPEKNPPGDIRAENDTVSRVYTFSNQLGYDDGIVDLAYGVSGESSQVAQKYEINERGFVYGVLVHFARINVNQSNRLFNLKLWKSLKGVDGADSNELLAAREMVQVKYPDGDNHSNFALFCFEEGIAVIDKFYIGIQQIGSVELHLGFDKNNNSNDKLHYSTFNEWNESSLEGTLMMRPVMKPIFEEKCFDMNGNESTYDANCVCILATNIFDQPAYNNSFTVFPNPVNDYLTLQGLNNDFLSQNPEIEIIDASGKLIKQFDKFNNQLFTGDLSVGMYFIRIIGDSEMGIQKFIKSE